MALAQANNSPTGSDYWARTSLAPGHTSLGVKGGISRSELQSPGSDLLVSPFKDVLSFGGGGYARHRFTRFVAVQAELLYERRGFRGGAINYPAGTTVPTSRLDYLALPVLLVGNLSERLSFQLGPQAAVLLAARYNEQRLSLSSGGYQRFDLGGVAGVELRAGPAHLGGRFAYSLFALNPTGTAVDADGQPLLVLPLANAYHSLALQAYLSFDLLRW